MSEVYTYRAGKKVPLQKSPDEFVVRAAPDMLAHMSATAAERVSPASARVRTSPADLDAHMARAREVAPTHHAYYEADSGAEFLITDRVVVTFRDGVTAEQIDELAGRYALVAHTVLAPNVVMFQLTDHTGMNPVKLVVRLTEQENALVATADHDLNHRVSRYAVPLPTDPMYLSQWHLHTRFTGANFDRRASSLCEQAWTMLGHFGSPEVVVAVTDDGCRLDHGDFNGPGKFAAWGYFEGSRLVTDTDIDAQPSRMYQAGANHGTSCAGVIAGEVDASLTVGAAPGCRLLPIKWESLGPSLFISDSKLVTALNFVADKADIVSSSWGNAPSSVWSGFVLDRVRELARSGGRRGKGLLFLWAAGNENCPLNHRADRDVPYTSGWRRREDGSAVWEGVRTARVFENNLVGLDGVMHVAALASVARRSHYSNYGTGIALCAPTSNSHAYGRLSVTGLGIVTATGESQSVTRGFGGTSSATPLTAGVAALVISANPDLTAAEVASILKRTASKDLALDSYPRTPAAPYDPTPTWDVSPIGPFDQGAFRDIGNPEGTWSPWYGHGRVDAAAAVAEALRRRTPTGTQTLKKRAAPALAIPDNRTPGVTSTLRFEEASAIVAAAVTVDIAHSWIGDLDVTLVSPAGVRIALHARGGGGARDLKRTYDLASAPGLAALKGASVRGDWTLSIEDRAPRDAGTLSAWELAFDVQADATIELQEAPGAAIPDADPAGIERALDCNAGGTVRDIRVRVDITHTYIGDLRVELRSPSGTVVALHERSGGPLDNLIREMDPLSQPALARLRGEPCRGAWRLRVCDLEREDVGKLNAWSVTIVPNG